MTALAPTLQAFFTERLIRQRHASAHTIAAYRDTLRLLLGYAAEHTGRAPSALDIADLDAPLIGGFLDHLEHGRGNGVRTHNARLAAIHSLFRFAALAHPEHAASIARVLAIPPKRFDRALISYLTEPEVDALLTCCDQTTWTGRRDHALLLLAVQTGLRVSELIGLTRADVHLGPDPAGGFHVGKIELFCDAEVPGIDAAKFQEIAAAAKAGCPISKLLKAAEIVLTATLKG